MKRRDFMALAGIAVAWPAAAQQAGRMPVIGILMSSNPEPFRSMFLDSLRALGYVDGKNIRIEYRNAEGDADLLARNAAELVRMKVDVLVPVQTPSVLAAKNATSLIPIAMQSGDPVATGIVTSLARPVGNITGMSSTTAELGGKLLELAREVNPSLKRVSVLANRNDPFTKHFLKQIEDAGAVLGVDVSSVGVAGSAEYGGAFTAFLKRRADAVVLQPSLSRKEAIELAMKHRMLSISPSASSVADGVLIGYSPRFADMYRALAGYVDKILKGAKPADLPIQQPTVFELAVNRKTANAIGIAIPKSILARADRIIE
jgi:putative ABC transport system substrate-binding protein